MLFVYAVYGAEIVPTSCGVNKCLDIALTNDETLEELLQSVREKLSVADVSNEIVTTISIKNGGNNTNIDHLPTDLLVQFPKLFSVSSDLSIDEITTDELAKLGELTWFSQHSSQFRTFSAGTAFPKKLKRLSLDYNAIESIDDFTFANISTLHFLSLTHNNLTKIGRNTLAGLYEVERVELDNNQIHTIEVGAFTDMKKLKVISLFYNKLKNINDQVFDGPNKLESVLLGGNQIENIGNYLYTISTLDVINLDDSPIKDIDLVKFATLSKVKRLDIGNTSLNLDHVTITSDDIKASEASPLEILNLYYNNITSIESLKVMRIFPKLKLLGLEGNEKLKEANLSMDTLRSFLPNMEFFSL